MTANLLAHSDLFRAGIARSGRGRRGGSRIQTLCARGGLGSMQSILKMLPSVGPFAGMQQAAANVDESQFTRVEAIINSMTARERHNSAIINGSRRKRIAAGSGTSVQEVNNLLKQHAQMSKLFKGMGGMMGGGGGMKAQQRLLSQMQGKQRFGR